MKDLRGGRVTSTTTLLESAVTYLKRGQWANLLWARCRIGAAPFVGQVEVEHRVAHYGGDDDDSIRLFGPPKERTSIPTQGARRDGGPIQTYTRTPRRRIRARLTHVC